MSALAKSYIEKYAGINKLRETLLSENTPFHLEPLYRITSSLTNLDDIIPVLKNYDIRNLFPPSPLNLSFPCYFHIGNMAWFSESNGHIRYFSRSYTGQYYSYDTVDMLSIYYNTENISAIAKRLGDKVGIIFLDDFWKKGQLGKYARNFSLLKNLEEGMGEYPTLKRFLSKNTDILILLNQIGKQHAQSVNFSYHKESMFFSSVRYLEERVGIDKGHISRLLSYMTLIGLIEKVPEEYIPSTYLDKSREIMRENGRKRMIGYFVVKDWGKCIDEVDRKLIKAISLHINPSNITEKKIYSLYGMKIRSEVYPHSLLFK